MKRFLPAGKMVFVRGKRMHVCGENTGPSVVLLAGSGCAVPSVDFIPLSGELQKNGFRTVIVEKFGYGFSDMTQEKRDIDAVIGEMREALEKAGEKGPYILCAHSLAGTEAVRWANLFPGEVLGMALLDAPAPLCYTHVPLPPAFLSLLQAFMRAVGLRRLLMHVPAYRKSYWKYLNGYRYLDEKSLRTERAMQCKNYANTAVRNEIAMLRENCKKAGESVPAGIFQVIFIASDTKIKYFSLFQPEENRYIERNHPRVTEVEGKHNLQHYAPELIAQVIAAEYAQKGEHECGDTSRGAC